MRVACCHDPLAGQEACVTVIGVESIPLPRIVTEYYARPELTNDECDLAPLLEATVELAIDKAEKAHLARPVAGDSAGCFALLYLTPSCQCRNINVSIPGSLRTIGAH